MSQHNTVKQRTCKHCGDKKVLTAKELKEHAIACERKGKKAA